MVWHSFSPIDFFSDWPPNPATDGDGMDRGYPCPWSRGARRGGQMTVVPSGLFFEEREKAMLGGGMVVKEGRDRAVNLDCGGG
ncbi:hypothetical protein Acr_00g0080920 [Actinidia rufa]|uniref:Uncharacterized protein n=1 Tax=Actinidia rufa TaxID=165716 RepID=A0A7J0DWN3_9ERIC|nr:hypothetical protein Acr_00g0080920 [Actinidia rufa]